MSTNTNIDFSNKTALLIDDDIDFLTQIELFLKQMKFHVVTGESQEAGEKLIKETQYDLAVFDLMMENHDSGFILSYKSKKQNPNVPIILATAVTNETGFQFDAVTEETRDWIKADVILDKDIRFEQLKREVEKLLKG